MLHKETANSDTQPRDPAWPDLDEPSHVSLVGPFATGVSRKL